MTNLASFQKLTLSDVARELAIHPFDLIRVLVANNALPGTLSFDEGDVGNIRRIGGIETWWTADTERPPDDIPERGLLRALCGQLVARGTIGDHATRLDNLLRGLDTHEQLTLRGLVQGLMQAGLLASRNTASGLQVSVVEGREYAITDIAEGGEVPGEAAALWA
jgi:hypothetical protein